MPANTKLFLLLASSNAALAVMLGAFGAHALKTKLSSQLLTTWHTAVQYHFYHALGLCAVAFVAYLLPQNQWVRWAGWAMVVGIVLFSGSLYTLCLTEIKILGAITPFGGLSLIAAWIFLVIAIAKQ